jgi:ketopantoate reductase
LRIVIVGAGAVGQVYGHHLALGGARVSVLVRPRRATASLMAQQGIAERREGFTLTRIPPFGRRKTSQFLPENVLTSAAELEAHAIDQIWLCLPTDALDEGALRALAAAAPNATIVSLAPGHFVKALVDRCFGSKRTVYGLIGMSSFVSPMKGSRDPRETATPPGIAYMLAVTKLGGDNERRALEAVSALRAGDCPTDYAPNVMNEMTLSSAMLMAIIASLEAAGWSFATMREPWRTSLGARAIEESIEIAAATTGEPFPFYGKLLVPQVLSAAALLAPKLAPLDVEKFLEVHFEKVDEQTTLLLETTQKDGERLGLSTAALSELIDLRSEARRTGRAASPATRDDEADANAE